MLSEVRWWPPGPWDLTGLSVCYVFSEVRWLPPGPWDLSGLFMYYVFSEVRWWPPISWDLTSVVTRSGTKLMPPLFFLKHFNDVCSEFYIYRGYIIYEVEIIFPQILLHYQDNFSTLSVRHSQPVA